MWQKLSGVLVAITLVLVACSQTNPNILSQDVGTASSSVAFLPPIGDAVTLVGDFDDSLDLFIEIYDMPGGVVAVTPAGPTLSVANGDISVTNDPGVEEQYHANWDTSDSTLTDDGGKKMARIEIRLNDDASTPYCGGGASVASGCLAFFDVELWDNMGQAKKAQSGTLNGVSNEEGFIDLKDGRTLPIKLHVREGALPPDPPEVTPTGSMVTPRSEHTATVLLDGRVLIAGGRTTTSSSSSVTSAELYDPATGTFTSTGSMHHPRWLHSAVLLNDGRVLIVGGWIPFSTPTNTAEIYDPATGTFTLLSSVLSSNRTTNPTVVKRSDGKVLILGGNTGAGAPATNKVDLFDPNTNTFTQVGTLDLSRRSNGHAVLTDGRILLFGGVPSSSVSCATDLRIRSAEVYNPTTNTATPVAASMNFCRAGGVRNPSGLLADGRALLVEGSSEVSVAAEVFDPDLQTFAVVDSQVPFRGALQAPLGDGRIFVLGAFGSRIFDENTSTFTSLDEGLWRFGHVVTSLHDGRVLITGGGNLSAPGAQEGPAPSTDAFLVSP